MKLLPKASSNSFVGNSALIFLARFFPALANFIVIIYFSHKLDTTLTGEYFNFWVRLYMISAFAGLGIQAFVITYQPQVLVALIKRLKLAHYLGYLVWLTICAAVFAAMQHNDIQSWLLPFCFLLIFVLTAIIESVLLAFRSLYTLIIISLLHAIVFCWLHLEFITASRGHFGLFHLFTALLVIAAVKVLSYIIPLIRNITRQRTTDMTLPEMKAVRSLWMHIGLYDVSQIFFTWIDKFIIGWMLTAPVSAIYNNGARDVPFLPLLMGAVGSAALMQLAADKDLDAPVTVMNKSGRVLSSIVFPVFFFLVCFRYELFEVVFSNKYLLSVPIFFMAIMVLPLRTYNFTVVLQNKHRGDLINVGAVLDLILACILMYPLYVLMGLPGVALSFVISTYLQGVYYLYHTAKILQVSWLKLVPLTNWLIKLIVFASLFIAIHYVLSQYYTTQIVLFCGILMAMLIAGASLLLEIRATKRIYGARQEKEI